ncbi:hypothetical protein GW17_00045410 [Ensete ventricosum]|nr:hypothetical protein GW17_00045410 [Ensete ventricosum]
MISLLLLFLLPSRGPFRNSESACESDAWGAPSSFAGEQEFDCCLISKVLYIDKGEEQQKMSALWEGASFTTTSTQFVEISIDVQSSASKPSREMLWCFCSAHYQCPLVR